MMALEGHKSNEDTEHGRAKDESSYETFSQKIIGGIREGVKDKVYGALKTAGETAVLSIL